MSSQCITDVRSCRLLLSTDKTNTNYDSAGWREEKYPTTAKNKNTLPMIVGHEFLIGVAFSAVLVRRACGFLAAQTDTIAN